MKKVKFILVLSLIVLTSTLFAQSEDPFRTVSGTSGTLKVPETNAQDPVETESKKAKVIIINNDVEKKKLPEQDIVVDKVIVGDILTVELVSLIGDKNMQTVELTIKFTNHQTNRSISIHNLSAYDNLGDSNFAYGKVYETFTDIPIKATFKFNTKVLPSKVHKMSVIKIPFASIKDVEFRNIKIDWR